MADDLRCSECGRPFTADTCGFVHAVGRVQLALIRQMTPQLFGGGDRG